MSGRNAPGVLLLGAGDRGRNYAGWIQRHPDKARIVGVAEPDPAKLAHIRRTHRLPGEACFPDWKEALEAGLPATAVIIATQDRMHLGPALDAMARGLHVLLEKPIAPTRDEVLQIAEAAGHARGTLTVCHVLRYSSFFTAVKRVVSSGLLGDIQSILHAENVSYYHFAHSYVRGNWSNVARSSPLILAKSCHDLDLLCWIADSPPVWVSSAAGLDYFTDARAPEGAPLRCTDGCPVAATCLYNAEATYLRGIPLKNAIAAGAGPLAFSARLALKRPKLAALLPGLRRYDVWKEWPTSTITTDLTKDGILTALREGPYGRCVFKSDNDQPDHQDTVIRFANGITATFRLHGRSSEEGRTLRLDGSRGTLKGRFGSGTILELYPHGSARPERIQVQGDHLGHSEADAGIMESWSALISPDAIESRQTEPQAAQTDVSASIASHLLAFAAHDSAVSGMARKLDIPGR